MRMYDLIEKKKQGQSLSEAEIHFMIDGYMREEIKDYQMAAFLMAVCFQGMTKEETVALTLAMRDSGSVLDLSSISGIKVDKHSTGGVGDKTTIALIAIVAALGVPVAKMSGRGLGHTGGTIDKLECFAGFSTSLSETEFADMVNRHGIAITGQSKQLAPADKKLYALRDVTATVDNISLIASSIMSKKLAAGCNAIVLDVTYGHGAFMKTKEDARELAKWMVEIGNAAGKRTVAVVTNMNEPLGYAVGNALEVQEAIDVLTGTAPDDLMQVITALGTQMLLLSHVADSESEAEQLIRQVIADGRALAKLKELVTAQGGVFPENNKLPETLKARYQIPLCAEESGYIRELNAHTVGIASMQLGGGRMTKDSSIDLTVGVVLKKKCGDYVEKGEVLAVIHSATPNPDEVMELLSGAYVFSEEPPVKEPCIDCVIH